MSNHPLTKLDFSLNISWNLLAKCVIYLPYSRGQPVATLAQQATYTNLFRNHFFRNYETVDENHGLASRLERKKMGKFKINCPWNH